MAAGIDEKSDLVEKKGLLAKSNSLQIRCYLSPSLSALIFFVSTHNKT